MKFGKSVLDHRPLVLISVSSQIDCHGDRISSEDTHNLNTMNTSQGIPTNSVTNGVHTTDNSHPSLTTAGGKYCITE